MAADVGSAVGYLDLDISGFLQGLKTAQSEASSQTKNLATTVGSNMQSAGKSMTSAGKTLTKSVTLPIVGIGTAIVNTSANFESAMSKVQAISGASGDEFDKLSAKAREMGAKTKFSASESAEAFQYMAMAGWDVDSMLGGISGVMNLAAASGEELGTVSDIVTDAMTAFGLSAKDTSKVLKDGMEVEVDNTTRFVDALAAASNSSNTNVAMLGESFKYVAPVAGALGYSVEDVAVALGLMANQGIKSNQAGTSLRTMLTNMANPTDTMAGAMNALGVSLENSDGSMKSLMDVMKDLRKGFGGGKMDAEEFKNSVSEIDTAFQNGEMSEEDYESAINDLCVAMYGAEGAQKAQLAAQLAGKTGMAGLLAIINSTDEDFQSLTDSIYNANGTSQEMADTMQNNLSGQLTILKSMLEELALQFGEILLPVMRKFVEWLQGIVAKLQEMSPEQREQIVKWAAIAAAIGPVLIVVGKLVTSIGGMISTFGKIPAMITKLKSGFGILSAAIGGISAPVVAIVAVVAVLVAAFTTLWKTNEDFRNKMTAIWNQIKGTFDKLCQGIVDRLNKLGFDFENIGEVLKAIWKGFCDFLAPIFEGVFQNIANIFDTTVNVILGILDVFIAIFTGDWEGAWNAIRGIFESVWNGIIAWFQNIGNTLLGILDVVCGWFGTTWEETWNGIKQFFVNIWEGISSFFTNMIESIKTATSNFITSIINFFAELPKNISNFIQQAWQSVVEWSTNMVNKAKETGKNFLNNIVEFFTDLPYKVGYFIGSALANVVLWVTNMVNKAKEMGTNFLNTVVSFFTQLPGKVKQFIDSAYENVKTWATNMINKAKEMGTNFINNVVTSITELPGKIKGFLDSAITNVATWVSDMGKKGKEAATSLIDGVIESAKNIPSQMASIGRDIVDGVWSGIRNAKDAFVSNVKGFFSGIVDGVKDGLGISSPSKVFADEVGRWLPPGVADGFAKSMPAATKKIQTILSNTVKNLGKETDNIDASFGIEDFESKLKGLYTNVALWFESIDERIGNSINNMKEDLRSLIQLGSLVVNNDGTLGYVGYGGFSKTPPNKGKSRSGDPAPVSSEGDTFNFYSPKPIDEVEAARQMKKTKQEIAEGF